MQGISDSKAAMKRIKNKAKELSESIVEWRRHFHKYPETGRKLPKTADYIEKNLRNMGIEAESGIGESGVCGIIRGKGEQKKCLAIRADMDALALKEKNKLDYSSRHEGKMHACGHDAHMAMALGAASLLQDMREELKGDVKLVFQPAEEIVEGAKAMIEDGIMESPPAIDAIIGAHIGNLWGLESGEIGYRKGALMAAADRIEIEIRGKGGHGGMPHKTVDAICVGAELISSLQNIVSRNISPVDAVVISIGEFESGSAHNIIAEEARLTGTVRSLSEATRERLPELIENKVASVCKSAEAEYSFEYHHGCPVLNNHTEFTDYFVEIAREIAGTDKVKEITSPTMAGEDMSYFLQKVPGTFFGLGTSDPDKGTDYPHHSPFFNVDEDVLWLGSALFSTAAYIWLKNN